MIVISVKNSPTAAQTPASTLRVDSLGLFREAVSSSFVPLDVSSDSVGHFDARVTATDADQVGFTEIIANPHLVERTPETIAKGGSGYYKVTMLTSGNGILVQDGRELVIGPGDLSVYDTSRPYSLLFDTDFRAVVMMFSKERLDMPAAVTEQLTAVSLGADNGLKPLVTNFLAQFPNQLLQLSSRIRTRVAHTSLDLMGTLFSSILDMDQQILDPHQAMLRRITQFIDANLGSADLSPASIARAHFISIRHLHALFSEMDTTVSTWIRDRRLERCRTDLMNPMLGDLKIAAVATRWGFVDAAHFSRVFRATYGVSPSELRHQ